MEDKIQDFIGKNINFPGTGYSRDSKTSHTPEIPTDHWNPEISNDKGLIH